MSEETTRGAVSDYEIIGGGHAVSAVVNDFYERVLGDSQLAPYFEEVDLAPTNDNNSHGCEPVADEV